MSIFKQSFPKWVREQLGIRQDLQSTGVNGNFKSHAALTWNQNKQCIIRATSLVDYEKSVNLDISNGTTQEEFKKLKGSQLSKKFILQGGILNDNKIRNNPFGQVGSTYGDPSIGSNGENIDGYGQVPMPGITQLDIKTKSAYGSLRQAKLSFVVHNLRQLEIMEMLYMRPGYPVVVEWGWSPFIDNSGEIQSITPQLSNYIDLFQNKIKQEDIYSSIINLKKDSVGNCDAFMGFVTNFGFQARADGGFDCYSEIVSMGEAIDSLKMRPIKSALAGKFGDEDIAFKVEETEEEIRNPDALRGIILALAKFSGVIGTAGAEEEWVPQILESENSSVLQEVILGIIFDKFPPIQDLSAEEKSKELSQYILRKLQVTEAGDFSAPLNTGYINWELFSFLINEVVTPKTNGDEPAIKIMTSKIMNNTNGTKRLEPLFYNSFRSPNFTQITDLSCDPKVCILPHSWFDTSLQNTLGSETLVGKGFEYVGDQFEKLWRRTANSVVAFVDSDVEDIDDLGTNELGKKIKEKAIGNIYLNIEMLLESYDATIKGNKNGSLGEFINDLWDRVNEACPLHNFVFKIDDEFTNNAYVIDLPLDNEEIADIEDEIFVVEVQSNKSVVRDYNLEATIPDTLKSTIAVHAQNPNTAEDVEDVTFQAFNKAISNRLYIPPPPPETPEEREARIAEEQRRAEEPTPLEKLIKKRDKAFEEFEKLKSTYFEIINYDENTSTDKSEGIIPDLKSTLKTLQSTTLEIELLEVKNISTSAVIPLEFNLTFDGISNILIGCIFKIREDRLPKAYRHNIDGGANVGFIVFNEEQSITAGQDWTTKIGGKMIMLPNKEQGKEFGKSGNNQGKADNQGKGNNNVNEKLYNQVDLLPILPVLPAQPISSPIIEPELIIPEVDNIEPTTTPAPPEIVNEEAKNTIFNRFVELDREYFVVKYKLNQLVNATWSSGTNVFANQINQLKIDLIPIVDRWELFRPQLEIAYGTEWKQPYSELQARYLAEEGNTVINIDINGQIYKPFVAGGGTTNLSPNTADTFMNDIFTPGTAEIS